MNISKKRDPRFWAKWRASGAVGGITKISPEKKRALEDAKFYLKSLHTAINHHKTNHADLVRQYAKEAGVTLKFLGTSEEELERLIRECHIDQAKFWLESFRQTNHSKSNHADLVRKDARMAGVTLESLGTSEEELELLTRKCYLADAKFWLESVRNPSPHSADCVQYVVEYAKKAGVSLEFLGTNEEELERLKKESYIANAKYWLEVAEKPGTFRADGTIYVREYAKKAGVSLESLGTSEWKLNQYAHA